MAAPVHVHFPTPKKERLRTVAGEQGISMAAFLARLYYMWESNPLEYEKLYLEAKGRLKQEQPERRRHS